MSLEKRSLFWLYGLHVALALFMPLILTIIVGCMRAKEKKEDLGPSVTSDAIYDTLAKAMDSASLNGLAVGQQLYFSDTRRIENSESAMTLGARKVEVIDRTDTPTQARFTLRITKAKRLNDGSFETTISEEALWLEKVSGSAVAAQKALEAKVMDVAALAGAPQPKRVTFHHLRQADAVIDPPAPVKSRAGCGGLNPCSLPVHYVQFDMVIWMDDETYQKISFDFAFSAVTPFLPHGTDFDRFRGALITDCRSTYIPIEGRTVYVRDCLALDDFTK